MTFETTYIDLRRRTALVLVAVATISAAPGAASEMLGCFGDPIFTGRTCPLPVCVALQDDVDSFCKSGLLYSCRKLEDCEELEKMKRRWRYCARARDKINGVCWGGGNAGHAQAAGQAWQNVSTCVKQIAKYCEDPCPQIEDTSLLTPDGRFAVAGNAVDEKVIEFMIPVLKKLTAEGLLETLLVEDMVGKVHDTGSATCIDDASADDDDR